MKDKSTAKLKDELKPASKVAKHLLIVYLIVFDKDKTQSYEPVSVVASHSSRETCERIKIAMLRYYVERSEFIHDTPI